MSNTEMNRQIVQEGLDQKNTARRQRMTDAAHDAAERKLRAVINQNAQERRSAIEAAEADERRHEECRRQQAAKRAQEAEDVSRVTHCMTRVFGSLLFAALMTLCFICDAANVWMAITAIGLSAIYCIVVFVKYTVRFAREKRAA